MTPLRHSGISIFVSHSHADNDFGIRLVNDLRSVLGDEYAVWYDAHGGLHGGEAWWRKIVQEVTTRNVFIVLLSPDSLSSKWVQDEVAIAWNQKNATTTSFSGLKLIVPLLCRPCNVPADLRTLQVVSFLPTRRYEDAFNELLMALEQLVSHPFISFQPPSPSPGIRPSTFPSSSTASPYPTKGASPTILSRKTLLLSSLIFIVVVAVLFAIRGGTSPSHIPAVPGNTPVVTNTPFVPTPTPTDTPTPTPSPTPALPLLFQSYTGTVTASNGTQSQMRLDSVREYTSGVIQGTIHVNCVFAFCGTTTFNGSVYLNRAINFNFVLTNGVEIDFKGIVNADNSIQGTYSGSDQGSGSWLVQPV